MKRVFKKPIKDIEASADQPLDDVNILQQRISELEAVNTNLLKRIEGNRLKQAKLIKLLNDAGISASQSDLDLDSDFSINDSSSNETLIRNFIDRLSWLIGLLIFQSLSSFILVYNEDLLKAFPNIIFFLTMLVGAGGNAGNQATVRAIREIALGSLNLQNMRNFLTKELIISLLLSIGLGIFGFFRVMYISGVNVSESFAISVALMTIVFSSVLVGAILPLMFLFLGIDPANSSTTIQVIMDISGVIITCIIAKSLLSTS